MVVGFITVIIIMSNIFAKRSKAVLFITFIWMWIIMAFTYGIADESIYMSRYNDAQSWASNSEILYSFIISVCNKIGMDFLQFKIFITYIQLMLIYNTVWKYAKYPNWVIALYFLCPFPLNVAQMRNALATSIFIFASRYLFNDKNDIGIKKLKLTKNEIKYIALILIATCVHTASFIWLVFLIAKKVSLKINVCVMFLINFVIYFILSPQNLLNIVNKFGAGKRMGAYLSLEYQRTQWRHYSSVVLVIFIFIIVGLMCAYILKKKTKFENIQNIYMLLNMNIIILSIFSIILRYTGEVYRMQEGLAVVNYIVIFNAMKLAKLKINKVSIYNLTVILGMLIYVGGTMWLSILKYLVPTIIEPILNQNYLF